MASEYLKYKFKDVQREEPAVLSPGARRKNWWYYHKWYFIAGGVLLLIILDIGMNIVRQFTNVPDYRIAYVGGSALPEDTARAIERGFAALGEDLNGDGKVSVKLTQYVTTGGSDAEVATATEVLIMGEARPYANEDGEDAEIFDAQVYLVLSEKNSAENARGALDEVLEMANSSYQIESTTTETYGDQLYTILTYRYESDTNPYAIGAAAYGVRGNCLVNVEVSCLDGGLNPLTLLGDFLHGCHYMDEEEN